jgi:asparagine synthase (glutamine-hydrolysing)
VSPPALTALELASGIVQGPARGGSPERPAAGHVATPFEALQRACLSALEREPCLVSFSGGRDSSVVLAAAVHAARREGLPLPIPATNRFPGVAHADETSWQELAVRHLGLDDWLRTDYTHELDVVGPVATRVLDRHGVMWPFNAHFHAPLLKAASGGTLLTGIGGDEVFGRSRWARATDVLRLRARPELRDAARIALLASPRALRRLLLAPRFPARFSWLTPAAHTELARAWAADEASEPAALGPRLAWLRGRRWLQVGGGSLELLARDAGAAIAHPLLSTGFGAALAAAGGPRGFGGRTSALLALFGDALPPELLSRTTKARFESAFWSEPSAELARTWDGEGADPSVVDHDALRAVWSEPEPDAHTFLLLQAEWLARHRGAKKGHLDQGRVAGRERAA